MLFNSDGTAIVKDVIQQLNKNVDSQILNQLNEFISRGLIVVEKTEPVLTVDENPYFPMDGHPQYIVNVQQGVRLKLKDQEYIEKLEKENQELRDKIGELEGTIFFD